MVHKHSIWRNWRSGSQLNRSEINELFFKHYMDEHTCIAQECLSFTEFKKYNPIDGYDQDERYSTVYLMGYLPFKINGDRKRLPVCRKQLIRDSLFKVEAEEWWVLYSNPEVSQTIKQDIINNINKDYTYNHNVKTTELIKENGMVRDKSNVFNSYNITNDS